MTAWILFLAILALLAVLSHRRPRLEQRVLRHVPLIDWLSVLIFPFLMFVGWVGIVRNITGRPVQSILPFDDFDLIIVMTLFLSYSFVGNGMHFTAKVIWRYLSKNDHTRMVWRVNEMFHNKIGHYIVYITLIAVFFLTAVFEINHPLVVPLEQISFWFTIISGIVFGFSGAKAIYYTSSWFGAYNRPIFVLVVAIALCLYILIKAYNLNLLNYPVFVFMYSVAWSFVGSFLIRQFILYSRLSHRNRLRFLHKIFSA